MTSAREAGIAEDLAAALTRHPAVSSVELVGSRARGEANELSDWDFQVETLDFPAVAKALPEMVSSLEPLAQQWDRLSEHACYMLLLRGIGKVDLICDEPWKSSPPWTVSAATLRGIDDHFWDWNIWLASKDKAGKREVVETELGKMHDHLLAPMGVERVPSSVADAIAVYTAARAEVQERLGTAVHQVVEDEVRRLLAAGGYAI